MTDELTAAKAEIARLTDQVSRLANAILVLSHDTLDRARLAKAIGCFLSDDPIEWIQRLRDELRETEAGVVKAGEFKTYTHERLDRLGAPYEVPESPHTGAGCRVGGRFDWVEQRLERAANLEKLLADALHAQRS